MLSPSLLVLALFGPALAPAPHAEGPTSVAAESSELGELRPIAWRDAPRARLSIAVPVAAPVSELREPFDVSPVQPAVSTMTVDPWALREPFAHAPRRRDAAPAAAPAPVAAPAPIAGPVAPHAAAAGLREPAWAR